MTTRVIMESGLIINPADSSCASLWACGSGWGRTIGRCPCRVTADARGAFHRTARGETLSVWTAETVALRL